MNIKNLLTDRINQAIMQIDTKSNLSFIKIKKSTRSQFGDYQINGLLNISKQLNIPIKNFTEKIIKIYNLNGIATKIKFEPPGFINIFLNTTWVENQINNILSLPNFGINNNQPKTIVIDYSGPNIAKDMHVGHLRSTVIGDSISRILSFLGHHVIRVNHIGDWGTQFGMLIAYIVTNNLYNFSYNKIQSLSMLESYYQEAKKKYDTNPDFAELARNYVVKLQTGNKKCQKIWKHLVNISIKNNQKLYNRLNITLKKKNIMGESAYQHMLPNIIQDLKNKKLAVNSHDATVVFLDNFYNNHKQEPFGVIVQKKDGGYLYITTDIACIKYRCEILKANQIIYYIDSRQKQHLTQAWEIANKAGYITKSVIFEHHICGMLLGKNGKPFKTRSGNALKLTTLLDEALNRAQHLIQNKNPNLKNDKLNKLAHIVSVGSIKYAELSKHRTTNYIFNWNNMLNFEGNTAPYIQYAYTRIYSILNKANQNHANIKNYHIKLITKEEKKLAICLLQFHETIITVAHQGAPNILCNYLYKVATLFSLFYENCPILTASKIYIKHSRIKLALSTALILKKGLNLLGIKTSEYM